MSLTCIVGGLVYLLNTFSNRTFENIVGLLDLTKSHHHCVVPILSGAIYVGGGNFTTTDSNTLLGDLSGDEGKTF